jgi:hypothetical protein
MSQASLLVMDMQVGVGEHVARAIAFRSLPGDIAADA